ANKQKLDAAIAKIKQEGVIQQLSKKYFGDIDVTVK
ncbi:MAG: ABC transporter substrate-binding protein, partial [Ewingella sp.]|nr:ABC transporter substrate-binding protein [Ewingella sp.]